MVETSEMCDACGSSSVPKNARFCPNCGSRQSGNYTANDSDSVPMVPAVPVSVNVSHGSSIHSHSISSHSNHDAPPLHVSAESVEAVTEAVTPTPTSALASTATASATPSPSVNASAAPSHQADAANRRNSSTPTATATARPSNALAPTSAPRSETAESARKSSCYFRSNDNNSPDYGNDNNTPNTETAMFWKHPSPVVLERAAHYQALGGILFLGVSGARTKGKFTVPQTIHCGQILTGNKLDLSKADFVHPVTTILVGTILGGFKLIVPRGVRVDTNGFGILGGFKGIQSQTVHAGEVDNAPLIILHGFAILGGAKVSVNYDVPPVQVIP